MSAKLQRKREMRVFVNLFSAVSRDSVCPDKAKLLDRAIKWSDFWKWDPTRISFLIRSVVNNMLPSPAEEV